MNEQIRELMGQAGIDVEAVENLGEMPTAIKFAELIVRETLRVTGATLSQHQTALRCFGVEE